MSSTKNKLRLLQQAKVRFTDGLTAVGSVDDNAIDDNGNDDGFHHSHQFPILRKHCHDYY